MFVLKNYRICFKSLLRRVTFKKMSGDRFQFDETGDTFCCFLVASFTILILPLTYFFWPKPEIKESNESIKKRCQCPDCQSKRNTLRSSSTKKWLKRFLIKFLFFVAWTFLLLLIFKLSRMEVSRPSFDPFFELQIDRDATQAEIKKTYKKLSLIHHPDRGGDEQKFIKIYKAYASLTDETAKKNWQEYGNPDGPEAIKFGIALPKWMIEKENTILVVGVYALLFVFVLPLVVGLWWYNTMKFSSTKVLLVTVRLFCGSFMYNPFMSMPRLIKLLSSAYEFSSQFNKDIACRPSDNIELHPLILQIPMFTIFKKAIVGAPYAIKARALIYAHMLRLDLPPKSLFIDKQYIIAQCPRLFEEMINNLLCVLSMATEERGSRKKLPQLMTTIENCMKLVPMLVQGLSTSSSPLLQLPHIGPNQVRQLGHGQRNMKTVRLLARMPEDKRRQLLRNLSDEQYRDILSVLSAMPTIEISCHCEVIDDEDQSIWPVSMVTATVKLTRHPLLNSTTISANCSSSSSSHNSSTCQPAFVDASTDLRCQKDTSWYHGANETSGSHYRSISTGSPRTCPISTNDFGGDGGDEYELPETALQSKKPVVPVWDKSKKRKGGKKGKNIRKPGSQPSITAAQKKAAKISASNKISNENDANDFHAVDLLNGKIPRDDDLEKELQVEDEPIDEISVEEDDNVHEIKDTDDVVQKQDNSPSSDRVVRRVENEAKRRELQRSLEIKERCSHIVHCPFFPCEKYEGWWVYLMDKKTRQLVTKPVFITSLQTEEELDLKFVAPPYSGKFLYTLCVRSDSYVDFDFFENVPFTVIPLPDHVIQSLKEAEARALKDSSDEEEDEDYEDDGYEEDEMGEEDYDDEEEEDEEEKEAEEEQKIDMERLSDYVANA